MAKSGESSARRKGLRPTGRCPSVGFPIIAKRAPTNQPQRRYQGRETMGPAALCTRMPPIVYETYGPCARGPAAALHRSDRSISLWRKPFEHWGPGS